MRKKLLILAGTKKGLFLFKSTDRRRWTLEGPFLKGSEINHAIFDPRLGRLFATANDSWFGSEIVFSTNLGKNWKSSKYNPAFGLPSEWQLERIWHLEPGPAESPKVLYAGVAPAALFRSEDAGQSWQEVQSLSKHPTRPKWHPGAGGLCLHSICLDANQKGRMYVGISAVGVFRTEDGAKTWQPANQGTRAEFLPQKYPEYGQCVHKLLAAPGRSSLLFQQNHCGVYRSADHGNSWQEITKGLPSDFGFPLAIHPREPETLFVLPLQGADFRCPPDGKLRVYRSRDGGKKWKALQKGLPREKSFVSVYREALAVDTQDPAGVYFGTNTGKLFASPDEGDSWVQIADQLPPVYSISTAHL